METLPPGEFVSPEKGIALPLYQQIKNDIRGKIRDQTWSPGQKLPSENELVDTLAVSRMTIHRALRELTQEGLLDRVHGLGTFVAKPTRHASLINLQDIADEVRAAGCVHRCKVLSLKTIKANNSIASAMELAFGTQLFHLRAVHYQDELPIQLEDRIVNPGIAPKFMGQEFTNQTATEYLISLGKPDEMEHIVQAILPDKRSARILMVDPGEPCIKLSRRTWKNQSVVTSVALTYPGSRYDLAARYQTDQLTTLTQHPNTANHHHG